MGGSNGAGEDAMQFVRDAVMTLQGGQQSFNANPLFQGLQGLAGNAQQYAQQFGPEETNRRQQQAAGTIHDAASGFLDQGMSRLSGTGSGTRGGAANALLSETASRFAPALAQQNAQIEQQVQQEQQAALVNAFNLSTSALGQQYAWPRDIAQTWIGGSGVAGSLANAPTPLQQGLGGVGSLGGSLLGAAGAAGGFSPLFSKGNSSGGG